MEILQFVQASMPNKDIFIKAETVPNNLAFIAI